jgi:DNA-directed RNA polymerase subunit RPC12/RpoP
MGIKNKCFKCGKIRDGNWALLFGPPNSPPYYEDDQVTKHHICPECYIKVLSIKWKKV